MTDSSTSYTKRDVTVAPRVLLQQSCNAEISSQIDLHTRLRPRRLAFLGRASKAALEHHASISSLRLKTNETWYMELPLLVDLGQARNEADGARKGNGTLDETF